MPKYENIEFDNCLYEGKVHHSRVYPKSHHFNYNVFCINFDLCKINKVFKKISIFSINKFNLFSFYYKDHGPNNCKNLEKWVKNTIRNTGVKEKIESIFVLAYPRILGYVFNPLSIYSCLDKNNNIIAQIYEVHNTFKQRYFYITKNTFELKNHKNNIHKAFHVSPFMGMKGKYNFKSFMNDKTLSIFIEFLSEKEKLIASFTAKKKNLSTPRLLLNFIKYPLMTTKVILGIHLEAIFLYAKGLKIFKCPVPSSKNTSNFLGKRK
ncbi:MAG: hypothetical protein CFH34_00438 [Alphaproteobacteria bacterium MarineAlpha9_Bin4]|nr:DUF1365 domain-containing protein [Pelagibacterales bacterium]PPR27161.1 MAG: hypothetical protein CFH34_00438 [Alphaproteobacteria bacterium MarineAlpha9_Bin4]|tara:strand:+ start:192 stop:986 length:795 start_codon:yes stop_codon:yes gene_type:complete